RQLEPRVDRIERLGPRWTELIEAHAIDEEFQVAAIPGGWRAIALALLGRKAAPPRDELALPVRHDALERGVACAHARLHRGISRCHDEFGPGRPLDRLHPVAGRRTAGIDQYHDR